MYPPSGLSHRPFSAPKSGLAFSTVAEFPFSAPVAGPCAQTAAGSKAQRTKTITQHNLKKAALEDIDFPFCSF
jgi:hypothetical protein